MAIYRQWRNNPNHPEAIDNADGLPQARRIDVEPHEQQMIDDRTALDAKTDALSTFFETGAFADCELAEQGRMREQWGLMRAYSRVLTHRIAANFE